jgi:hypothetical protein
LLLKEKEKKKTSFGKIKDLKHSLVVIVSIQGNLKVMINFKNCKLPKEKGLSKIILLYYVILEPFI